MEHNCQRNGATPHKDDDNPRTLDRVRTRGVWNVHRARQPPRSRDRNMNHVGLCMSLKSKVSVVCIVGALAYSAMALTADVDSVASDKVRQLINLMLVSKMLKNSSVIYFLFIWASARSAERG